MVAYSGLKCIITIVKKLLVKGSNLREFHRLPKDLRMLQEFVLKTLHLQTMLQVLTDTAIRMEHGVNSKITISNAFVLKDTNLTRQMDHA